MKNTIKLNSALLAIAILFTGVLDAQTTGDDELKGPHVQCPQVTVPDGHRLHFRTYAIGVQVYRWNGTNWAFVAPVANLYADPGFRGQVGTHYAGPTWESNSGSFVVARRVDGCTVDPSAVQWLLLEAVSTSGFGIFGKTSYIQRVNTAGGVPPAAAGLNVGDEARVPYTTEYYFYRAARGEHPELSNDR